VTQDRAVFFFSPKIFSASFRFKRRFFPFPKLLSRGSPPPPPGAPFLSSKIAERGYIHVYIFSPPPHRRDCGARVLQVRHFPSSGFFPFSTAGWRIGPNRLVPLPLEKFSARAASRDSFLFSFFFSSVSFFISFLSF